MLPAMAVTRVEHTSTLRQGKTIPMTKRSPIVGTYTIKSDDGIEVLEIISKSKGKQGFFIYNTYDLNGYYAYQQLGLFIGNRIIFTEIGNSSCYLYVFNLAYRGQNGVVVTNAITDEGTQINLLLGRLVKQ